MGDAPTGRENSSINQETYDRMYWEVKWGGHAEGTERDDPLIEELVPQPLQIRKKQMRPPDLSIITGTANPGAVYDSTTQEDTPSAELQPLLSSITPDARHVESYWDSNDWNRFNHLSSMSSVWFGQSQVSESAPGLSQIYPVGSKQSRETPSFRADDLWTDKDRSASPDVWILDSQLQGEPQPIVENSPRTDSEPREWNVLYGTYNEASSAKAMSIERPAMDLEPLHRIRRWILSHEKGHCRAISSNSITSVGDDAGRTSDAPISRLIQETKDLIKRGRSERESPAEMADNGSFGPLRIEYLEEYVKLLEWLEQQGQEAIGDEGDVQPEPRVLSIEQMRSTNRLTKGWVREELDKKFKHMRKVTLREERHRLRLAIGEAKKNGDAERERALILEKQRMTRRAFAECKNKLHQEVKQAFERDISQHIFELEDLYVLYRVQEVLLLDQHNVCMLGYREAFDQSHRSVTFALDQSMPLVELQLGAISSIIELGLKPVAAVHKCIDRLSAKDVRDPVKREVEKQKRLSEPEALEYMLKVSEDDAFLQQWGQTVISGFEDIDRQLSELSERALDMYMAADGWLAFVESKE